MNEVKSFNKAFVFLQMLALLAGNYVGWSTIFKEVDTYCDMKGGGLNTLFDFSGTVTSNPLLSACFWGSMVFVIALGWTIGILLEKDTEKARKNLLRLWWLLLAGTIFAAANNVPIFYNFYTKPDAITACSGGIITNPFATSCFLGFSAFFTAFVFATLAKYLPRKKS